MGSRPGSSTRPTPTRSSTSSIALSRHGGGGGGIYASHLRYDGEKLREGVEEAIAIGEGARIPVHIFHLKVTGRRRTSAG